MKDKSFSIVVPIFNEEENIVELVNETLDSLKSFNSFEIIIINDGSSDNSINILNSYKEHTKLKIINRTYNKGQSYSIREGIKKSKYKTIVTIDGDGQNNPFDIPNLLNKYFSDSKIFLVGGIRRKRKDNIIKIISSVLANKIRSYIFKDNCIDTGCSLKVFDRDIFLSFPFFTGIHRFLPALYTGFGYKTFFIDVDHRPRIKGVSKYGTLDRLYKGVIDIIKVRNIINNFHISKR